MLAPEAMRGSGGILLNSAGERFCNELGTRAAVTAAIMASCTSAMGSSSKIAFIVSGRGGKGDKDMNTGKPLDAGRERGNLVNQQTRVLQGDVVVNTSRNLCIASCSIQNLELHACVVEVTLRGCNTQMTARKRFERNAATLV